MKHACDAEPLFDRGTRLVLRVSMATAAVLLWWMAIMATVEGWPGWHSGLWVSGLMTAYLAFLWRMSGSSGGPNCP